MKKGFTLVELMVVVGLFVVLFGAMTTVLFTSERSWRTGQNKVFEQQEARKVMDNIAGFLRQSNPSWLVNGTYYNLTITSGKRIDFYQPIFNAGGDITQLKKVTFKLNPDNPRELLRKLGLSDTVLVSADIEDINFGGGCAGCATFTCSTLADDCPMVEMEVKTKKNIEFALLSRITLRNHQAIVSDEVEIEEPGEGEF